MKPTPSTISRLVATRPDTAPIATEGGLIVTYEGDDSVDLVIMEDRFPKVGPMRRLPGTALWYVFVPLDPDGAIQYRLGVTRNGKRRLILDPGNPETSKNPFGANSLGRGPEYVEPAWIGNDDPGGTIESFSIKSESWGRQRKHLLYLPDGFSEDSRYPLLLMHDGPEYVEYAGLKSCLDALIGAGEIPPLIAFLHAPEGRNEAYTDNPRHIAHVADEVLPRLRLTYQIGPIVAGGASLGGVASLSLAYRRPGTIDALLLQSGSFVQALGGRFRRGKTLQPVTRLLPEIFEDPSGLPEVAVMSCGTYDGLVEDHRQLAPLFSDVFSHLTYEEIHAGHHWQCWRDRLQPDLKAVFDQLSVA